MSSTENPYRIIRKSLELTQIQLASLSDLTPQVVLRTEQGLFATPPSSLTQSLASLLILSPSATPEIPELLEAFSASRLSHLDRSTRVILLSKSLVESYSLWIEGARRAHNKYRGGILFDWPGDWPLIKALLGGTVAGAAVQMVYQISLLQEFEKHGWGSSGVKAILETLGFEFNE